MVAWAGDSELTRNSLLKFRSVSKNWPVDIGWRCFHFSWLGDSNRNITRLSFHTIISISGCPHNAGSA